MSSVIEKIRGLPRRIRVLARVMPLFDAVQLALGEDRPGDLRIYLKPVDREVVLRGQTVDLQCLEKVFIAEEYRSPFELSPELIVDGGANVGMATLFFARSYPEARIVAIEPELSNFEMLQRNCQHLGNVTLIHGALWHENGELRIDNPGGQAWGFRVSKQLCVADCAATVPAVTIADILDRMNVDHIDLLKLDIEGSELELFSKNSAKWLRQVDFIVIELHDWYVKGCSHAFYSALISQRFSQVIRGENVFVKVID